MPMKTKTRRVAGSSSSTKDRDAPTPDPRSEDTPWEGYDGHTEAEVIEGIEVSADSGQAETIEHVWIYELAHRRRFKVVKRAEELLPHMPATAGSWRGWIGYVLTRPSHVRPDRESCVGHALMRLVHVLLAEHADLRGVSHPSVARVASQAGCSVRQARRCLERLEAMGYLRREADFKPNGAPTSNVYTLLCAAREMPVPGVPGVRSEPTEGEVGADRRVRYARAAKRPENHSGTSSQPPAGVRANNDEERPGCSATAEKRRAHEPPELPASPRTTKRGPARAARTVGRDRMHPVDRYVLGGRGV
jgi:hypothetical protein